MKSWESQETEAIPRQLRRSARRTARWNRKTMTSGHGGKVSKYFHQTVGSRDSSILQRHPDESREYVQIGYDVLRTDTKSYESSDKVL